MRKILGLLPFMLSLAACDTFDHFQKPPDMSSPGKINAIPATAYQSQPLMAAMPPPELAPHGSLWLPGAKTFFRDPRARTIGDLVTVAVSIQDQGQFNNQTQLQRNTSNSVAINNVFGLGTWIGHMIPGIADTTPTVNTTGSENTNGKGQIQRSETIVTNVAATVVSVLPNGNLEIAGSQEIRLDNELRDIEVRGIVRPEDIASDNTIPSDRIAEARINYAGRGVSSDLQRPKWGQDVLSRFEPF
ncbi:MAG TPA: flagellar basal body L-ring protein FlgH [Acetobacteraceae bacterium]|nr:flagellar basal body L-ring protein FlgH [Acetobacteraceae bacterium]